MFKVEGNKSVFSDELIELFETKNYAEIEFLINDHPTQHLVDSEGTHLLHLVAKYNGINIIAYLINLECNINVKNKLGRSPWQIARMHNNVEAAAIFIEINATNLDEKLQNFHLETENDVQKWQKKRAPVIRDFYKQMIHEAMDYEELAEIFVRCNVALCEIVRLDDLSLTKAVLQLPCDWICEGYEEYAIKTFNLELIKILFHHRLKPDALTERCLEHMLENMPEYSKSEEGRAFFEGLFTWEIINENNLHCLEKLLIEAGKESVAVFLQYDLDKILKAECDRHVLSCLFANINLEVIQLLKNADFDPNGLGCTTGSPLHYAAEKSIYENIELLLERGADPYIMNCYNITPVCTCLTNIRMHGTSHDTKKVDESEECFELLLKTAGNVLLTDITTSYRIFAQIVNGQEESCSYSMRVVKLFITQVATFDTLGLSSEYFGSNDFWNDINALFPESHSQELQKFHKQCCEQLKPLNRHEVCEDFWDIKNPKITMLTILAENPRKIAYHLKRYHRQTITEYMEIYKEANLLDHYYGTLEEHIKFFTKVNERRKSAACLISECSGIPDPYHIVIEHIVSYLTFEDLLVFR